MLKHCKRFLKIKKSDKIIRLKVYSIKIWSLKLSSTQGSVEFGNGL